MLSLHKERRQSHRTDAVLQACTNKCIHLLDVMDTLQLQGLPGTNVTWHPVLPPMRRQEKTQSLSRA